MQHFEFLNAISALEKPEGIIAFPTDTVYGLGCKVDKPEAIEKIYRIKGRDEQKPLILLGHNQQSFLPYVDCIPSRALDLMEAYWPGPLTLVLPKSELVPETVTRGFDTIGIRVPACQTLLDLLQLIPEGVLATTSANRSNDLACISANDVRQALGEDVDYILEDDAQVQYKTASTVIAVNSDGSLQVLRSGGIVLDC